MKIKEVLLGNVSCKRISLLILVILAGIVIVFDLKQNERVNTYQEILGHYMDTYQYKQVSIKGAGRFNVLSVDGGKNWYTYNIKDNGGIKITGTFEEKISRVPIN